MALRPAAASVQYQIALALMAADRNDEARRTLEGIVAAAPSFGLNAAAIDRHSDHTVAFHQFDRFPAVLGKLYPCPLLLQDVVQDQAIEVNIFRRQNTQPG